jgi:NAD+ synthase
MIEVESYLINWIRDKVDQSGHKGGVVGISGGIDSAVVASLLKKAYPNNSLGLIMPCHSNPKDVEYGYLLAKNIGIDIIEVDLTPVYDVFIKQLSGNKTSKELATANIKPRLRMSTLYYYAVVYNYLVIGTGNKSEILTGYFTKYGDGGVDIEPLGNLYKSQVFQLAKHLNIPEPIIQRAPTAGLWDNQTDEDELGMTYRELDKYLYAKEGDTKIVEKVEKLIAKSKHKRQTTAIPEKEFPVNFY